MHLGAVIFLTLSHGDTPTPYPDTVWTLFNHIKQISHFQIKKWMQEMCKNGKERLTLGRGGIANEGDACRRSPSFLWAKDILTHLKRNHGSKGNQRGKFLFMNSWLPFSHVQNNDDFLPNCIISFCNEILTYFTNKFSRLQTSNFNANFNGY